MTGRNIVILTLTVAMLAASASVDAEPPETTTEFDRFLGYCYENGLFNGGVFIRKNNDILLTKTYGYADVLGGKPLDLETSFELASVSKQFTAMGILILVDRGLLHLNDNLSKFFPGFPDYGKDITVHHLLTHQSGIQDYANDLGLIGQADLTDEDILPLLRSSDLHFEPGTSYQYSNSGYYMLARIIEMVSGQSFGEFLRESIFDPLGMRNTFVRTKEALAGRNIARGLNFEAREQIQQYCTGATGICSSVSDLQKWFAALCGRKLISAKLHEKALTAASTSQGQPGPYGYGWRVSETDEGKVFSHGGSEESGFMAYFMSSDDCDRSLMIVYNYYLPKAFEVVVKGVRDILKGDSTSLPEVPLIFRLHKEITDHGAANIESIYDECVAQPARYQAMDEVAFNRLAGFYMWRNLYGEAETILKLYKSKFPDAPVAYDALVELYQTMGVPDKAKKVLQEKSARSFRATDTLVIKTVNPVMEDSYFLFNVRSGPGMEYSIIEQIEPGESFVIVGRYRYGGWLLVENGGFVGDVCARHVAKDRIQRLPLVDFDPMKKTR